MGRLMRACVIVLLVFIAGVVGAARADECDVTWSSVGEDFEALFEAPFHMDEDAAYLTLGVTAFTGASIIWFDDDVDAWVRRQPDSIPYHALHQLSRLAGWYGASNKNAFIMYGAVTAAIAAGGAIADDDYVMDTSALMLESGVFTFALNAAVKLIIGRKRPQSGESHQFEFLVGANDSDTQSFFSGHTSAAFAGAGVAAGRHPHWYVEVPSYLFAVAAGWQRVDSRAHWLSDVVAGGFFGYAISELLVDRHECPEDSAAEGSATPTISFTVRF